MQIAAVLAVAVVLIFVALGAFGIGRSATAPTQPAATGSQDLLKPIAATGGVATLQKYVTVAGTGTAAKPGDTVTVTYIGALLDGTVFDQSSAHTAVMPGCAVAGVFCFALGEGHVIQGWDQGLVGAKKGEHFILAVPPSLGYGGNQVGTIPPNSTLIFDIEVIDITSGPASQ
jgi:FKBP-type peptidyl-prolyl cis-trans isomerase